MVWWLSLFLSQLLPVPSTETPFTQLRLGHSSPGHCLQKTSLPYPTLDTLLTHPVSKTLHCSLPTQNPPSNSIIRLPTFSDPVSPNSTHGIIFLISQSLCHFVDYSHLISNTTTRATTEPPPALWWETKLLGLQPYIVVFVFQFSRRKGKWIKD